MRKILFILLIGTVFAQSGKQIDGEWFGSPKDPFIKKITIFEQVDDTWNVYMHTYDGGKMVEKCYVVEMKERFKLIPIGKENDFDEYWILHKKSRHLESWDKFGFDWRYKPNNR